jgi:hypothetical protein
MAGCALDALTVTEPDPKADCVISAGPVAFRSRVSAAPAKQGQIIRGKIVAGRHKSRPGLGTGRPLVSPCTSPASRAPVRHAV